jgi:hypothetical protein
MLAHPARYAIGRRVQESRRPLIQEAQVQQDCLSAVRRLPEEPIVPAAAQSGVRDVVFLPREPPA